MYSPDDLSLSECCGQLLCLDVSDKDDPATVERLVREMKPGGIFVAGMAPEKIRLYRDMVNRHTKIPCIVAADVEYGPGSAVKGIPTLPHPMAWGASHDPASVERAGYLTAVICRAAGIDYTLSPVVDINYNFNNPVLNVRSVSDDPDRVMEIAGAYYSGMKRGGLTAACKHFPGDGMDDRNQHFCTTENSMPLDRWRETYGRTFGHMIALGIESVMAAHIALPAYDTACDEQGYRPAVLSRPLMTDLLKGEMGFDGCVVSDAMSMIGACSRLPVEELAPEFVRCGGDFLLFPDDGDARRLEEAVRAGTLSGERLRDAVSRVLRLKERSGLFFDRPDTPSDTEQAVRELQEVGDRLADESIKTVRDRDGLIARGIRRGDRVLVVGLFGESRRESDRAGVFDPLLAELAARDCRTEYLENPGHRQIAAMIGDFDRVLVCAKFLPSDFCCGASLRMGWESLMAFWRGYLLDPEKMIFTSFGNPYALYEMPYLRTCINTFSPSAFSQRGLVRRLFLETKETAQNPVSLPGFFRFGE